MNWDECVDAYNESGLDGQCFILAPGGCICLEVDEDTDLVPPAGDTPEMFIDRIERSKESGKNLFLEEWEPDSPIEGVLY